MSVLSPPPQDELEALIREARARQRKRWFGAAVAVALLAGVALSLGSILSGGSSGPSRRGRPVPALRTHNACGTRGLGDRILGQDGETLYRAPGHWTNPNAGFPTIRCGGSTIWAVWTGGAATGHEFYVGARSRDRGRTWRLVFAETFFGIRAPHTLDAYPGPWALRGPQDAYFVGECPACGAQPTVSLWVTKDGGRTFRSYGVGALGGYWPTSIRVRGPRVTISAKQFRPGDRPHKTASIHVG